MKAKYSLIAVAALGALSLLGANAVAGSGGGGAQAAAVGKVSVGDNFFSPAKKTVRPGDKVKWTNDGKVDHNVTFAGGSKSGNFGAGESYVKKFNRAGKFPYSCTLHAGMTGKVKVG